MNYWHECVSEAFDDVGITATQDQIDKVADWVMSGHDNYGMAHGHEHIPDPQMLENEKLQKQLDIEKSKVTCSVCKGGGQEVSHGPIHSAYSECYKCRGEGRHVL